MKITIDKKVVEVNEDMSILDAALSADIYIPHLCKHPDLEAVGGCRLCSVEIEGFDNAVPSCKTRVKDGMNIQVNGPKAEKTRTMALELILATHPSECTGCPKYGKCELQSIFQYLGVGPERWKRKARTVATDESNPLIKHLFTRCIRCGRCVRACRELRGVKVLDYQKTEDGVRIGIDGNVSLEEAGCRFCGACIEVCPTGAIMDAFNELEEESSYAKTVVPCRSACPAEVNIPMYARYIREGKFIEATAIVREKVPFPEVLGSVCNHICEGACKRNELGVPLSVCKLKRAAAVHDDGSWKKKRLIAEESGKKVAVIGAGPAGLTAAYYLRKKGHTLTIFEENQKAGGQLRYGIPAYRLPDEMINREIEDILEIGIELKLGQKVEVPSSLLDTGYDAVLIAIGTHLGSKLPIEGNQLKGVRVNAEFLKDIRNGKLKELNGSVMILGGGNVAYDCARSAIRLGASKVHIACLENEEQMTATPDEIKEGFEEGIILHASHSFLRIVGSNEVEGVELQKVKSFSFDSTGKPILELVEASKEIISVEQVIFAVGQKPVGTDHMGIDLTHGPYIKVASDLSTSKDGIFAVGDVVTGTQSVIKAIAGGRKSAEEIDKYLGGDGDISEQLLIKQKNNPYLGKKDGFIHIEREIPKLLSPEIRKLSFDMIENPLTKEQAQKEASRCLQCDMRLDLTKPKLWNEY